MLLLSSSNSTIIYLFPQNTLRETYLFGPSIFCDLTRCASYNIWHTLPFPFILFWLKLHCQFMLLQIDLLIIAQSWSCACVPYTPCLTLGSILPQPLHLVRFRMRNGSCWWLQFMMVWLGILQPYDISAPTQDLFSIHKNCFIDCNGVGG